MTDSSLPTAPPASSTGEQRSKARSPSSLSPSSPSPTPSPPAGRQVASIPGRVRTAPPSTGSDRGSPTGSSGGVSGGRAERLRSLLKEMSAQSAAATSVLSGMKAKPNPILSAVVGGLLPPRHSTRGGKGRGGLPPAARGRTPPRQGSRPTAHPPPACPTGSRLKGGAPARKPPFPAPPRFPVKLMDKQRKLTIISR